MSNNQQNSPKLHWRILLTSRKAQIAVGSMIVAAVAIFGVNLDEYKVSMFVDSLVIVASVLIFGIAHEDNGKKRE